MSKGLQQALHGQTADNITKARFAKEGCISTLPYEYGISAKLIQKLYGRMEMPRTPDLQRR